MEDKTIGIPIIRAMSKEDLGRIVEIDTKVLDQSRPNYWEMKLELIENQPSMFSLVAELGGLVIGFIIGDARGWEYGVTENIGWIDAVGVDPDYQRSGIAKMLMTETIKKLKNVGVDTIYTFINWRDWSLLQFFDASGFKKGDMINLELKV